MIREKNSVNHLIQEKLACPALTGLEAFAAVKSWNSENVCVDKRTVGKEQVEDGDQKSESQRTESGKSEINFRDQKTEAGKSEIGGRRSEIRKTEIGGQN